MVNAQEYVKQKVQELQELKQEIEHTRSIGSEEQKAASIAEFHEKVMIIQHEIAQTVEQANAGVQRVRFGAHLQFTCKASSPGNWALWSHCDACLLIHGVGHPVCQ